MNLYPAIDLKNGNCVRLFKGDMAAETVYNKDPVAQALQFQAQGFKYLHMVDLNGAVEGKSVNGDIIRAVLDAVDIPVQLGGGIRDLDAIENWIEAGVARVILGTAAVHDPNLVSHACRFFPGQVVVGIDARGDKVAVSGWVEASTLKVDDLAKRFADAGVAALIYTDIDRDGTGLGLNIEATRTLGKSVSIPVIASGGVGSIADIRAVHAASADGVDGVIIGTALYDGRIAVNDLKDFLNA